MELMSGAADGYALRCPAECAWLHIGIRFSSGSEDGGSIHARKRLTSGAEARFLLAAS